MEKIVEFAVGAFGIDEILEGVDDLLDGDNAVCFLVAGLVDDAVGALVNFAEVLIVFEDVIFELLGLFHNNNMLSNILTQLPIPQLKWKY